MIISFSTSVATGPIVVHYFNQFSLAGIISNMVIVPFAGMAVVPLALFSGLLALFTGALPLAGLNQFMADRFIDTVTFFSRMPIAEFHPPSPGIFWLVCYAVFIVSLFSLVRARLLFMVKPLEYSSRVSKKLIIASVLSFALMIVIAASAFRHQQAALISFPDVGQGDSILIQLPSGSNMLIDGGGTYDGRFDIGRQVLAPYLWNRGVRSLDLVILSHPHPDHMNGLKFILKKFAVSDVWTHGRDSHVPGIDEFIRIVAERNIRHSVVSPEELPVFHLGDSEVRVLHPSHNFHSGERKGFAGENDSSLVVQVATANRMLLFTGDIGSGAERALVSKALDLKCDVLKVPHHGSKSSSCEEFLSAARPSIAVVTVGNGNRYHHPSQDVMERYERHGVNVLRTDRDGAVEIEIRDGVMRTTTWNDLKLRRVSRIRHISGRQERENWRRLWLRKWEF
jgi:competence protein ComEC